MSNRESKPTKSILSDKEYFQRWYEENKEQLLEKRRKRWRTDPSYREDNIRRKQESRARARKKKEKFLEEMLGTIVSLLEKDGLSPTSISKALSYFPNGARGFPKIIEIERGPILVYPMGYLCMRLVKTSQTIRIWHQKEILPDATYVDSQNWRWYSWDYIQACAAASKTVRESGSWALKKFKVEVEKEFSELR